MNEFPERRSPPLSEYRLTRVEDEQKEANRKLDGLDSKLDELRKDLFERHPFVPTNVFTTSMAALTERVKALEQTNTNNISNGLIKFGLAVAIIAAIIGPIVGVLVHG